MSFHSKSYELHSKTYEKKGSEEAFLLYKDWFRNGSVDIWRHLRMLEGLNPFLKTHPGATWLTVGDGHFGTSATYINERGGKALATDIDPTLLELAKQRGLLADYRLENAEALSFPDESFDYIFCKEAFHHFPRPYIALYEMLRCARSAILFSEPRDFLPMPVPKHLVQGIKNLVKRVIGKPIVHPDTGNYEEIGNYIYTISRREFQKIALALNFPYVAFRGFHDVYFPGVEQEKLADNGPLFRKIKRGIFINDTLTRFGLNSPNRINAAIFKKAPSQELLEGLKSTGFEVIKLPENPYI